MSIEGGIEGLSDFERDLDKFLDIANFAEDFIGSSQSEEIIEQVINQALHGRGPGGKRFKKYSNTYAAMKRNRGGIQHAWMEGVEEHQHMLARENFHWEFNPPDQLVLIWTPANERQAVYGPAHNEGEGKMPQREWMHLEAPVTVKTIDMVLDKLVEKRELNFNMRWR